MRPPPPSLTDIGTSRPIVGYRKGDKTAHPVIPPKPGMPAVGLTGLFFTPEPRPTETDIRGQLFNAAQALSLPPDELTYIILRFARHFSLPLERVLLKDIRKEAIQCKTNRDAAALASCASHAKGLSLDQASLELYAAAVDPGTGHDSGEGGSQGRQQDRDKPEYAPEENTTPLAPATALLRRLNGAEDPSGARWVVLPFTFSENGIEFKASLRLLFSDTIIRRMALDVAWNGKRRSVVLDIQAHGIADVMVFAAPPFAEGSTEERLQKLSDLLQGLNPGVRIISESEGTPFADCLGFFPPPVDEEA